MTTQQVILVLFPITAALCAAYSALSFVFWYTTRRTYVSFFNALFFLVEFLFLVFCALATGKKSMFDIEEYKVLVAIIFLAMAIVLVICIVSSTRMIYSQGTHTKNKCLK